MTSTRIGPIDHPEPDPSVNPHDCPHPEWTADTNWPGDRETRCTRCGSVRAYTGNLVRPCCDRARVEGRTCELA